MIYVRNCKIVIYCFVCIVGSELDVILSIVVIMLISRLVNQMVDDQSTSKIAISGSTTINISQLISFTEQGLYA